MHPFPPPTINFFVFPLCPFGGFILFKSVTAEMEANVFCVSSGNMQKHIKIEISLKIPQRIIVDDTNVSECRNKRKQNACKDRVRLLLMAVTVFAGWRNGGGLKKNRKEGREQGRRGI